MTKQLIIILTTTILLSCNNKEDIKKKETTKKDLIGQWIVTKVYSKKGKVKATVDLGNGYSVPIEGDLILEGSEYKMGISFNEDNISNSGSFILNTSIKISNLSDLSLPEINPTKISDIPVTIGTWDVKDNKLINKTNTNETSVNIVSFSDNKITFSYPISEYIDNGTIQKLHSKIKDVKVIGEVYLELTK